VLIWFHTASVQLFACWVLDQHSEAEYLEFWEKDTTRALGTSRSWDLRRAESRNGAHSIQISTMMAAPTTATTSSSKSNAVPSLEATLQDPVYYQTLIDFLRRSKGMKAAANGAFLASSNPTAASALKMPGGGVHAAAADLIGSLFVIRKAHKQYHRIIEQLQDLKGSVVTADIVTHTDSALANNGGGASNLTSGAEVTMTRRERLLRDIDELLVVPGSETRPYTSAQEFHNVLTMYAGQSAVRQSIWKVCNEALVV
jgi:hypothetical protein